MARPERKDVDYFPFYAKDGRTLFILEGKYRCKGTGFFTNLMRFIALQEDHHYCIKNESDLLYFFTKCHCDKESGLDMIEIMVETGKLDRELWEKEKVLASQDFLNSVQDAYRKRNNECITIIELRRRYKITGTVNPDKGGNPAEETQSRQEKGDSYPQTKLKKTKLYKRSPENGDFFKDKANQYFKSIESSCLQILNLPSKNSKEFNPCQFVNRKIKKDNCHPGSVDECLKQLIQYWKTIESPWSYANNILKTTDGNWWEKENIKDHKKLKRDFDNYIADSLIKDLIQDIGEAVK